MADIRIQSISAADKATLQRALDKIRRLPNTTQNRPHVEQPEEGAPEVYVAKTLEEGIPALANLDGSTGTDTEAVASPGHANVEIYQLLFDDSTTEPYLDSIGIEIEVFNLSTTAIPADTYVLIKREKSGSWFVEGPETAATEEVVGTGTGDGTFTYNDYKTECIAGLNNLFVREITIRMPLTDSTAGAWVFDSFQGCCDCPDAGTSTASAVTTGTGSSVGTASSSSSATGTGVGTSTGVSPCDPITIQELDVRCEAGVLNLYRRTISININSITGCLEKTTSAYVFAETQGCCDCPEDTGTATVGTSSSVGTATGTSSAVTGTATSTAGTGSVVGTSSSTSTAGTGTNIPIDCVLVDCCNFWIPRTWTATFQITDCPELNGQSITLTNPIGGDEAVWSATGTENLALCNGFIPAKPDTFRIECKGGIFVLTIFDCPDLILNPNSILTLDSCNPFILSLSGFVDSTFGTGSGSAGTGTELCDCNTKPFKLLITGEGVCDQPGTSTASASSFPTGTSTADFFFADNCGICETSPIAWTFTYTGNDFPGLDLCDSCEDYQGDWTLVHNPSPAYMALFPNLSLQWGTIWDTGDFGSCDEDLGIDSSTVPSWVLVCIPESGPPNPASYRLIPGVVIEALEQGSNAVVWQITSSETWNCLDANSLNQLVSGPMAQCNSFADHTASITVTPVLP